VTHTKDFLEKNVPNLPDFKEKSYEIAIYIQLGSSRLPNYRKILKKFPLSSLTYSQIWLIPLVDICECGYIKRMGVGRCGQVEPGFNLAQWVWVCHNLYQACKKKRSAKDQKKENGTGMMIA
jgi:hypothetical protein